MIEMLGVLAIIGVLSAGGIMGYSVAMEKYHTNQTIDDIYAIANGINNAFVGKIPVPRQNVSAQQLQALGIVPARYKLAATGCEHDKSLACTKSTFGGDMLISLIDGDNDLGRDRTLVVAFYDIPKSACVALFKHNWTRDFPYLFVQVGVPTGYTRYNLPNVNADTASGVCANATYMRFYLYLPSHNSRKSSSWQPISSY